MITEILSTFFGFVFFLLPGLLLCYLLFPRTDLVKRLVYSLTLSVSVSLIAGIFLYFLNLFSFMNLILVLTIFSIFTLFLMIILELLSVESCRKYATSFNKDIFYLLLFSIAGSLWRKKFFDSIPNKTDSYSYAFHFVGGNVPNLGYYTGMASDRVGYIGTKILGAIFQFFSLTSDYLQAFIITFLFLGFIYIVFRKYRADRKMAYLGVALMAFGPIELFYLTASACGHPLAYISLFPLFLFFKSKDNNLFWVSLLLAIAMMFTYYTASITMLLASVSFAFALFLKYFIYRGTILGGLKESLKSRKFWGFICIALILALFVYLGSAMGDYSLGRAGDNTDNQQAIKTIENQFLGEASDSQIMLASTSGDNSKLLTSIPTNYKDPSILGFSAIRWQIIFFFLCGLTFIAYLIFKKNFSDENLDLLLCLVPVLVISYGFFHVNLAARIFDYFAFFGLLVLRTPAKTFKIFFVLSLIFIVITGFGVAHDKKVFFELSDAEINGATEISNNFTGKIFADQPFANQLIMNGYYQVTGASDKDWLVKALFYQNNRFTFRDAIKRLNNSGVSYIAITQRMQNHYVLMVNYPQKAIVNFELYEKYLDKIYDNGDVRIYSTSQFYLFPPEEDSLYGPRNESLGNKQSFVKI